MAPLSSDQRKLLEKVIVKARKAAEAGAKNALEMLAVDRHEPHASMSTEDRTLRNRLRARGRQLGDVRDKVRGIQSIDHLVHEVAYEYWHRMLFARFLTENQLLIEPSSGVAISMEECEELARDAGEDPRSMAARFAQNSLPQIFRSGDPVLEVALAPESRQALDKLLDSLPVAVFTAEDSLGWTYQFWQIEKKDAVNAAGNKIGADELPAVTQLFTEHYMVLFLYHNTIGAWHAGKVLAANPGLAESVQDEDELRQAVRLRSEGSYHFEYLRFVRETKEDDEEDDRTGPWRPAAGTFDSWPTTAKDIKLLDPCCGSGHFLTEGFELMVRLRMDEEGLNLENAIHGVLDENLHGLELDPRCTQIAAFNLAMASWKLAGAPIELPALHIACSGLAVGSTKAEWAKLAGDNDRLRAGMNRLHDLFKLAPELGSLIDPKALKGDLFDAGFAELQPLLEQALASELNDVEEIERVVAAQGMARAAELLSGEYTLAITNVPYLKSGNQSDVLKEFACEHYMGSKADLATVFVDRTLGWLGCTGSIAAVTPQNWLFLTSYKKFREKLLKRKTWNLAARLGPGAFETISGEVVNVALPIITGASPRNDTSIACIDASSAVTPTDKALLLCGCPVAGRSAEQANGEVLLIYQEKHLENPDSRLTFVQGTKSELLCDYAYSYHGLTSGDSPRMIRFFWEFHEPTPEWLKQQSTVSKNQEFGGCSELLFWNNGSGPIEDLPGARKDGQGAWGKIGVTVKQMGSLPCAFYLGSSFDNNCASLVPFKTAHLAAIWCYCSSDEFSSEVRKLDQKLSVTSATLAKVPFHLGRWQAIAAQNYPSGIPDPQSSDPTQWLFHGYPAKAEPATVLQVAVGRLLGYRWPPELDPEMRLADEAREWVARCDALKKFADEDGIVCLSATRGERSAAERLRELLAAVFGPSWSAAKERELLTVAGDGKKPSASLEVWLRDKFFEEHCKLFLHRPFVWHIWDGNKEGFHCLVNGHKITGPNGEGRRTLEAVTYSYLGDWIDRQKAAQAEGKEGTDARLAAAQDLQGQLVKILEGEPPFDLFVRWKPIHEQAISWDPDINDGMRLNARPFMNAELSKGGKKGAGLLRWKPNIKWGPKADRGTEPQSLRPKADFPWFWGCEDGAVDFAGGNEFDGNRWNDLHYSISDKQAARERYDERKK
ncbi:MAG: SAM-dependent DNA methyltransferase [bacterium]|nr:SAM-dependent DNA methyltransferase [bacterium]